MKKNNTDKRAFFMILTIVGIIILMILEALLNIRSNVKTADNTSKLLLQEVETVLERNAESEENLTSSLKEDYITRAGNVAYIIENGDFSTGSSTDLKEVATMVNVDEISLFNEDGVIFGSTNPEYLGVSMNDGQQVSFFKAMLYDKTLTLCQDVTPNTAKGKEMMYAATWNADGTMIVQIGITPSHLLKELNHHEMSEVIDSMPMMEGVDVYVADFETGEISGATNHDDIGKTLDETGIIRNDANLDTAETSNVDGKLYRVIFTKYEDYTIGVLYDFRAINKGLPLNLTIVFFYLLIFTTLIFVVLTILVKNRKLAQQKLDESNAQRDKQFEVLNSMSEMYLNMHLLDFENRTITEYGATDAVRATYKLEGNQVIGGMAEVMRKTMTERSSDLSREDILEFTDLNTIRARMKNVKTMYRDFLSIRNLWSRAVFITIRVDEEGYPISLIYAVQVVDQEKRKEDALLLKSNTDGLTRCFNRRAYEDDIADMERKGIPDYLVLLSMDVNGLKKVNDSLGHAAGDELILGAVNCMKEIFGSFGKIYRTGGDEFILLLTMDEPTFSNAMNNFTALCKAWNGNLVKELSVSSGYVFYNENKSRQISEMEKLADAKMYKDKAMYYASKGVDRRGQSAAYNALCLSYAKVLKVNLTDDTFQALKVDDVEKTEETGYKEKISDWLKSFALSGQVIEEDREKYLKNTDIDYLRQYFKDGNESYMLFYKRHGREGFKKSMMEMAPAENYSDDSQVVYLYVKYLE